MKSEETPVFCLPHITDMQALMTISLLQHRQTTLHIHVMQKVGLKYQKNVHFYGKDCVYYLISRHEWQAR